MDSYFPANDQPSAFHAKADWARICGVTAGAVSHAIKNKRIVLVADGIRKGKVDENHPTNQRFREMATSAEKGGRGRPAYGTSGASQASDSDGREGGQSESSVARTGKLLDAKLKSIKIRHAELVYAREKKELIPAPWIARHFAEMASILEDQFRQFDARVSEEICDMAGASDPAMRAAVRKKIHDEVDISMRAWKSETETRMDRILGGN